MEMVQIYSETFDLCLMQFCDFEWIQLENWKKKTNLLGKLKKNGFSANFRDFKKKFRKSEIKINHEQFEKQEEKMLNNRLFQFFVDILIRC